MAIANTRIHIICGLCGCKDMLWFSVVKELNDDTNKKFNQVYVTCKNCKSLTALDEVINREE
jgi:hypothetical protein